MLSAHHQAGLYPQFSPLVQRLLSDQFLVQLRSAYITNTELQMLWNLFNLPAEGLVLNQVYAEVRSVKGDATGQYLFEIGREVTRIYHERRENDYLNLRARMAQTEDYCLLEEKKSALEIQLRETQDALEALSTQHKHVVTENAQLTTRHEAEMLSLTKINTSLEKRVNEFEQKVSRSESLIRLQSTKISYLAEREKELEKNLLVAGNKARVQDGIISESVIRTKELEEKLLTSNSQVGMLRWVKSALQIKESAYSHNTSLLAEMFKDLSQALNTEKFSEILIAHLDLAIKFTGVSVNHGVFTGLTNLVDSSVLDAIPDDATTPLILTEMIIIELNMLIPRGVYRFDMTNTAETDQEQRISFIRQTIECYLKRFKDDPALGERRVNTLERIHSRLSVTPQNITPKHNTTQNKFTPFACAQIPSELCGLGELTEKCYAECVAELEKTRDALTSGREDLQFTIEQMLETIFNKLSRRLKMKELSFEPKCSDKLTIFSIYLIRYRDDYAHSFADAIYGVLFPALDNAKIESYQQVEISARANFFAKSLITSFPHFKKFRGHNNFVNDGEYASGSVMISLMASIVEKRISVTSPSNVLELDYLNSLSDYIKTHKQQLVAVFEHGAVQKQKAKNH